MANPRGTIGYLVSIFPGLTETFIAREIEALKRRGFGIVVFAVKRPASPPPPSLYTPETLAACVYARPDRVVRDLLLNVRAFVTHPIRYSGTLRTLLTGWADFDARTLARLLYHFVVGVGFSFEMRRRGVAHLHCHFTSGCTIALVAHLYARIPFSFTAHASDDLFVRPVHLPLKLRHASLAIAVSEYSRRYLDSVTGYAHSDKVNLVHNGIDVTEPARLAAVCSEDRRDGHRRPDPLRLVSVGHGAGVKGFVTLVEVCGLLRDAGYPVHCTIIGVETSRSELLTRRIAAAGLRDAVVLAGRRSLADVYRAMHAADVFVLLSEIEINGRRDGFPTVILEAMALALPVVATWVSGIPELVDDQVSGILVPERNPRAAAAALQRLHDDPVLRQRMGAAGRARVGAHFGLDQAADQVARLLSETMAQQ